MNQNKDYFKEDSEITFINTTPGEYEKIWKHYKPTNNLSIPLSPLKPYPLSKSPFSSTPNIYQNNIYNNQSFNAYHQKIKLINQVSFY
jgi:hypothetical protein